jgi:hypothetical protein
MNSPEYEYLYDKDNQLVHFSKAIRGADYKMYIDDTDFLYTYKSGDQRQYFVSKYEKNKFANVGGESANHYNAKMKIAHDLKYFDTVFNQEVFFDKVVPERWYSEQSKRPDLSCYQNGKLVACIEILNTSRKSDEDIERLKELDCLIIEIDINNENRCEHIALPKVLESNREKYKELSEQYKRVKREEQCDLSERVQFAVRVETQFDYDPSENLRELKAEYNRSAENLQRGLSEIFDIEEQIETGSTFRVKTIANWLQKRLPRDLRKQFNFAESEQRIRDVETRITEINSTRSPEFKRQITDTQSRISKIIEEIKRIEGMVRFRRTRIGHEETKMQRGF